MAVERNAVIKLHKGGKTKVEVAKQLNMNRSTVWKIVKNFQETGNALDHQGAEENWVSALLNSSNTSDKLRRNPRWSCRNLATTAGLSKYTMYQVLRDDLRIKPCKILHRQEFMANHVAMRVQHCRKILQKMTECMLLNFLFTYEKKIDIQQVVNHQNDRVWASSSSTEGRSVTIRQNLQFTMV